MRAIARLLNTRRRGCGGRPRFRERETVGLPWVVSLGFVRITTSHRIFERPLSADEAFSIVGQWLEHPLVQPVEPQDGHWERLQKLLTLLGTAGNLTTDAHLAALAIEHGATLYSADHDFARFEGLRWINPL